MNWQDGPIEGCLFRPLARHRDERGWLSELFRHDELPKSLHPPMAYVSMTKPGMARGPHEHEEQTDFFVFFHGTFRLYVWDGRKDSATFGNRTVLEAGEENPCVVVIPPRIVHAYRNVGDSDALMVNCPDRMYAGPGRKEKVDEIRHEDKPDSPFMME
ncbi:MAG: dTDP-4-dehydrorhamnose 3,5-epimerase family protein, partial [Planctomycetota bacterium]